MPIKKQSIDEKLDKTDVNLFEVLAALDKKDYHYYDSLTEEQKKKIIPFMLIQWMSAIKGSGDLSRYYLLSVNEYANKHLFSEYIQKHPKLIWMMLCTSSPGLGKQFHQWIPHIKNRVATYKEEANLKDIKEYNTKIYTKESKDHIEEMSKKYVTEQRRKTYLGNVYPFLKIADLEILNTLITDAEIEQYEKDRGNKQ